MNDKEQWKAVGTSVYMPNGGFDVRYCPNPEALAVLLAAVPNLLAACEAAEALINRLEDEWCYTTPEGQALRAVLALLTSPHAAGEGGESA